MRTSAEQRFDYEQLIEVDERVVRNTLKRADGRLAVRSYYRNDRGVETLGWLAPRWAVEARLQCWSARHDAALIKLLRRAMNSIDVRDALIAAIEAGLVIQLAKAQNTKS